MVVVQRVPLDYASVQKPSWRVDVPPGFVMVQGVSLCLSAVLLAVSLSDTIFALFVVPLAALCCLVQFGFVTIPGWILLLGRSELPALGRLLGCGVVTLGPVLSGLAIQYGMHLDFCC